MSWCAFSTPSRVPVTSNTSSQSHNSVTMYINESCVTWLIVGGLHRFGENADLTGPAEVGMTLTGALRSRGGGKSDCQTVEMEAAAKHKHLFSQTLHSFTSLKQLLSAHSALHCAANLDFRNFEFSTVRLVKRVKLRRRAKFCRNHWNCG